MTHLPQNTCYVCDKPLADADSLVRHTYWKAQRCRIHKDCAEGFAAMATEGHCSKHDEPTVAMPGHASGYPCFEHRKTV